MFYVGDMLFLEEREHMFDLSDWQNFSGCVLTFKGMRRWYRDGKIESPQDPVTGKRLPAIISVDGTREWAIEGVLHSFRDSVTGELMPAVIYPNGNRYFYDRGSDMKIEKEF